MLSEKVQNTQIKEILDKYEHYGHMNWNDLKAFNEYYQELHDTYKFWNFAFKDAIREGKSPAVPQIMLTSMAKEVEAIDHIKTYNIYRSTLTSLYVMNAKLLGLWQKEFSGYSNNPFFDFQKLVKLVNAYWDIEEPYKPANKIAYGWKFSMDKADDNGYYCKGWKLYMWGCIKNYLIKNGIDFTKEESLKVRKIVGLVDIYDTTE